MLFQSKEQNIIGNCIDAIYKLDIEYFSCK